MYVRITVPIQAAGKVLRSKEFNQYCEDERGGKHVSLVVEEESYLDDRFDYLINHKIAFFGYHGPYLNVNEQCFAFLPGDTDVVSINCDADLNPFICVNDLRHEHRIEEHIRAHKVYRDAVYRITGTVPSWYKETLGALVFMKDKIWGSKDSAEITITGGDE